MKHYIIILALLFCVASSEWILRDLKVPRVRSTAVQVGNKLYIAGGEIEGGSSTSSIEVLNTDNFEFEQVDISLPSPRQRFTAVPIGSKIYFSGGSQNSIDVYDTSSNSSWTVLTVPSLQSVNITFAGSLGGQLVYVTSDGNALFINTESSQVTDSIRLCNYTSPYSADTRAFLQMPEYDGKLYAPCGGDILFFNANFVQKLGARSESSAVVNHMLVWAPKSILFIADISANQFYFYTIDSSRWDARLLSGRRKDYAIATVGTNVYIMGGSTTMQTNGTDYAFGFSFNAEVKALSVAFDLKVPRSQMTPFSTSNAALFIGGIAASGKYMSTIDIIYEGELKAPGTPTTTPQSPTSQTGLSGSTTLVSNFITVFVVIAVCLLN